MPKSSTQRKLELLARAEALGLHIEDVDVKQGGYTFVDGFNREHRTTSKVLLLLIMKNKSFHNQIYMIVECREQNGITVHRMRKRAMAGVV